LDDGVTLEFPAEALELYNRVEIKRKVRDVVAPLRQEGIEEARFVLPDKTPGVVVHKDDVPAYDLAPEEEADSLHTYEQETFVEVVAPNFKEGKWRLALGEHMSITADIEDEAFRARIADGEPFRQGDYLRVRMRVVQSKTTKGLRSEHSILEVLEHIERPSNVQLAMPQGDE
jgi:hypothetical protein